MLKLFNLEAFKELPLVVLSKCLSSLYFNVAVILKRKAEGTQEYFHCSHKDYSRYFQVISKQGQEGGKANRRTNGPSYCPALFSHTNFCLSKGCLW